MSISSISSVSSHITAATNNSGASNQLQNQRANILKQIQAENKSKDDEKIKQQKIQQLQAKLSQINAQIQQKNSQTSTPVSSNQVQSSQNVTVNDSKNNSNNSNSNSSVESKSSSSNSLDTYA
ncbi:hypothetical protein [uncultured Clostridium sp.]|uniref:hypothetical protein n=1 Tax=uncultured Clostridium sp. TaxID=59620 RepID=UPI0028EC8D22|nr:hypothetical protein [uncultured Clostridium sp.]